MTPQEQHQKRQDNFQTNMARLVGYAQGTVKELSDPFYGKRETPEWMSQKLRELSETIEHVWINRYERVVDFDEYSNSSLRQQQA